MPIYSKRNDWGGNSISKVLFMYLRDSLDSGKTILELGSGWGTQQLMKHWNVISIEDKPEWHKKYNPQSHLVPIKDGWYDYGIMKDLMCDLRGDYDLLLVDGPYNNRQGLIRNFHLFDQHTPVVFDDVRQAEGRDIGETVAEMLGRPFETLGSGRDMFGVT